MALTFTTPETPEYRTEEQIAEILADPGFGRHFTDHMASISWSADQGWHDAEVIPYGPIPLDPAAAVLHYAQEIFEGMKAYRHADGSVWTFRPQANAQRFNRSATRLALPTLDPYDFIESIRQIVAIDERWVPSKDEQSLYLRPVMFATEANLAVRASRQVRYLMIASPVGAYFSGGVKPVDIWLEDQFSRAAEGGTGAAKCGGNYAASLLAQQAAEAKGCSQVLFLDAIEHRWVEELGGMNFFYVTSNGELVTPEITGTILEGVTRSSVLQVGADLGLEVIERRIAWEDVAKGIMDESITEVFACGTAAVITPIASIRSEVEVVAPINAPGEVSMQIRQRLLDVQYGRAEDVHGWMHRLV